MEHHILCKNGLQHQREEANEQNLYTVVTVKTAGCTENQGSWLQDSQQHKVCFFIKMEYQTYNN